MSPADSTNVTRRLAAIVIADVVGYTRLMDRDDTGTFARLRTIRDEIVDPAIVSHGGRIVKTAGDGLLAEFTSALSALRASVQIQREMATRNVGMDADDRIDYRIGVNLGDVMVEATDIAGDGVNVASRLESLAEPGGICVSSAVREQVHGQLDVEFVDIGEQQVKNIDRPIRIFHVGLAEGEGVAARMSRPSRRVAILRWSWVAATVAGLGIAGTATWVLFQPGAKPASSTAAPPMSIAVMPFTALGGTPADEQFADALSREVTNGLGRTREFRVASHSTVATWKGKPFDARALGREFNVRYLAEGEIRRAGERASVSVQLIDAATTVQLWSGRFELPIGSAVDNEGALSRHVTSQLRVALSNAEERRAASTAGAATTAIELVNRANALLADNSLKGARDAGKLLDEALQLDAKHVPAMNARFSTLFLELELDLRADREAIVRKMGELTARAVAIDYEDAEAWSNRALALAFEGRLSQALAANDRARQFDPSRMMPIVWRAWLTILQGRPDEALALVQEARKIFPGDIVLDVRLACMANLNLGRYDEAISLCERSAGLGNWYFDHVLLAAAYANKGDAAKAAAAKAEIDKRIPGFSIAALRSRRYSVEPAFLHQADQHLYPGLRKAGIPEQ